MKKLVTIIAVLLMTSVLTPDSRAQCIGCSQGVAPSFAQPIQTLGTPIYNSAPVFSSAPVFNSAPSFNSGQVVSSTPIYNATPVYEAAPVYNAAPVYDASPVMVYDSAPAPVSYSEPIQYGSPVIDYPILDGGSCCGGGVITQGIVGQPIYGSASTFPVVSQGLPVPVGTYIDGGMVVGETVVVSAPTTSDTGDSVSPPTPVAEGEVETPSPDQPVEKKMSKEKKKAPQEDDGT